MIRHSSVISRAAAAWVAVAVAVVACGGGERPPAVDSAALAAARADSLARAAVVEATALRDSAQATLATLLRNPASAVFDSVVVVQPPPLGDRLPPMAVCGRIRGKPGLGGSRGATRFVYQTKFAVFVEEAANAKAFGELWGRTCAAAGSRVVGE